MYSAPFQAIIDRRRSNRRFDPLVEVPDEVIKKSIERAILSPNSSNMQLWEFYWIKDEEEKKKYEWIPTLRLSLHYQQSIIQ